MGALSSRVLGAAISHAGVGEAMKDEAYVAALLRFEACLAKVQGAIGVIPADAASKIQAASTDLAVNFAELAEGVRRDGVPTIALLAQLRVAAGPEASRWVHFGATSQDAMDTAALLQMRPAVEIIQEALAGLVGALAGLAERHRATPMAARTHGQHAVVTSFGCRVAGWLAPLLRHRERLAQLGERLWVLQLGGAAGTLSAMGERALQVREGLARELELQLFDSPWHTQRDGIVELASWLAMVAGSLAKMAQDIILSSQTEVSELAEAAPGQRGGSSCMPQKNNPMRCEQVIACARAAAGSLASLHASLPQEHERGTHGWQVEWLCLPGLLQLCAGALQLAASVVADLQVYPERMRQNLRVAGDMALAERITSALSGPLSVFRAREVVARCSVLSLRRGVPLPEVVRAELADEPGVAGLDWGALGDVHQAMGFAPAFADAVVRRARAALRKSALP